MTENQPRSLFDREIIGPALLESLNKLDPRVQIRNPVMFVVEIGAVITTVAWLIQVFGGHPARRRPRARLVHVQRRDLALAHGRVRERRRGARGGPRARPRRTTLRAMRTETVAKLRDGGTKPSSELVRGDVVVVEAGEAIPGDGTVIEGIASVDESAITGESAPVIREAGGDRSAVTGSTKVLSDRIVVEITQEPGKVLPGPDDRPGRGRGAAQDAERDRARHPARRADAGLHVRDRVAAAVRRLRRAPTSRSRR